MIKATDFKFDVHASIVTVWTWPLKFFFENEASVKILLAEICTLARAF